MCGEALSIHQSSVYGDELLHRLLKTLPDQGDYHADRSNAREVGAVKKFIHDENLKLYRRQLSETMEDGKRQMLIHLIRDELLSDLREEPNAAPATSRDP